MMSIFDCSEVTAAGYGNSNVAGGRNDGGGVDTNDNAGMGMMVIVIIMMQLMSIKMMTTMMVAV